MPLPFLFRRLLQLALVTAAFPAGAAPPPDGVYLGRQIAQTMHFTGAEWLTRTSRNREEEPRKLLRALKLERGQTVCDLGCGNGFYTLQIADKVAPNGVVYATDIQPEMLELLAERAKARRVENVRPVLATDNDAGLPDGELDLVLMVDVYHELSDPAETLAAVRRSLKPAGRVALVEFRAEDPDVPIQPLHKMTREQCVREFAANGLALSGEYQRLPWQHLLFFSRDDAPAAPAETPSP
ncbi:MAG: class I SAM-dependent methyltransferase [Lacipirellulaceae bacterium]